jgi:hypothetical protein
VLTEKEGRKIFQNKQEIVEATPERLDRLARFKDDLKSLLSRDNPQDKSHEKTQ